MSIRSALLSGCGAFVLSSGISSAVNATEITFYYPITVGAPLTEIVDKFAKKFQEENPEITINSVYTGNRTDTLLKSLTAAKSGNPPTVSLLLAAELPVLLEEGVLEPLNAYIDADADKGWIDGFYETFMRTARTGEDIWSIPYQPATVVLYWNKDAFKAAGLDPETPPSSWEQYLDFAKKLTKTDASGKITQYGIGIPSGAVASWMLGALANQKSAALMNDAGNEVYLNSELIVETVQQWVDLALKEKVSPEGVLEFGGSARDFLEGRFGMVLHSNGQYPFFSKEAKFEFGTAALPNNRSVLGGGNLYIFKDANDEQKQAAFKFIKYLTSPENLAQWTIQTGYAATRPDAWETPAMLTYIETNPSIKATRDQLAHSVPDWTTYERPRTQQILNDDLNAAIVGTKTAKEAMDDAQEDITRILRPYQN